MNKKLKYTVNIKLRFYIFNFFHQYKDKLGEAECVVSYYKATRDEAEDSIALQ